MSRIGRNAACPCGSGKKYKHCCLTEAVRQAYTSADRAEVMDHLHALIGGPLAPFMAELEAEFQPLVPAQDMSAEQRDGTSAISRAVFVAWALFDARRDDGTRAADVLFAPEVGLSPGARAFLTVMRSSAMRLYQLVGARPGATVTLRDLIIGGDTIVHAPRGSRELRPGTLLAARVVQPGLSGLPEFDDGLFALPEEWRDELSEQLRDSLARFLSHFPGAPDEEFFKLLPPFFNGEWRRIFGDEASDDIFDEPADAVAAGSG